MSTSLPSPPQGSRITTEQRGKTTEFSGASQGIPLRLFAPEELGVVEKMLRIKSKLTGSSTGGAVGDLFAEQVFEWSLEIAENVVTLSSKVLVNDCVTSVGDVKRVYGSEEGYLVAELSQLEDGKHKEQILTGELSSEDSGWLFAMLVQLLNLDEQGVAKPQDPVALKANPTESFTIVEQAGGSRLEIQHHTKLLHRILPLLIGGTVLGLAGYGLLGDRVGGEGVLPDLVKSVSDDPLWSEVLKYAIITGLAFLVFKVVQIVFGTLKMAMSQNSFEIKKGILGVGVTRSMSKSQMTGLTQTTWRETTRDSDNHSTHTQYWKLELNGSQSITILNNETNPEDSEWLGRLLSEWFEIPFEKTTRSSRFR